MRVLTVVPGPAGHGVVRHGLAVAGLLGRAGAQVHVDRTPVEAATTRKHDVVHAHFTDALWGDDVEQAAGRFERWARTSPRPLVVTLHDVPGTDADATRDARRRTGYRRVAGVADAVVVSAAHEAEGARRFASYDPVVVPLPVEPLAPPGPSPDWAGEPSVVVLGFLYPGKGHGTALEVVAQTHGTGGGGVRVVAAGGPSPGHEGLVDELRRRAEALGVELVVTGALSEADLHAAARAATVPLAAYRTLGASGSLATWLAAGRRPLTTASAHARELVARSPGALLLCDPDDPAAALREALAEPARTWLDGPAPRPDVAAAHLAVFRTLLA